MSTAHPTPDRTPDRAPDRTTVTRTALLAVALAVTTLAVLVGGLLWPEPAGGGETYAYADIAPVRGLWWGLLSTLAVVAIVNVPLQALAAMQLVRGRGSAAVTVGGCLMWLGVALQATGVAGWASAYFYATDPALEPSVGSAVVAAANGDQAHLFGLLVPGALLVVLGTVLQSVGLLRAHVVPRWIPVGLLFTVLTFVVPGSGAVGLLTSLPMAAGAIGLAWAVWRSTVRPGAGLRPSDHDRVAAPA